MMTKPLGPSTKLLAECISEAAAESKDLKDRVHLINVAKELRGEKVKK